MAPGRWQRGGLGRALPGGGLARPHARALHQRHEMGLTMPLIGDAVLLRIFIGEDDKAGRQPLYEAIVLKARKMGLAGATVLRGPMGFGHSSRLHTTKVLRLSQDLPLVIEIVENEDTINRFVSAIESMMGSALITTEKVKVIRYGNDKPEAC